MKITINEIKNKMIENGLKESSANTNIANLKRIARQAFDKDLNELTDKDLKNYYCVFGYVASDEVNNNVKKTLLNSVINVIKCIPNFPVNIIEKYKSQFDKQAKISDEARELAPPSEKELTNLLTMKDVINKRDEIKLKLIDKYVPKYDIPYLILNLYTLLEPQRQQVFINCKVYNIKNIKDKNNYIDLRNKQLVINDYKTVKLYGRQILDLPDELIKIITNFKNKSKSKFLIPKSYNIDESISPTNLTHLIQRVIGKKCSSQMLRKIFISEMIDNKTNVKTMKETAKRMLHSVQTQQILYSRFTKNNMNNQ